jgi:xylose isomerase
MLAEVGAWGVNLHDNDLVPIDATPAERDRIVREFKDVCERSGITVPMATVNLFYDPAFRDGALTANDPSVRAYALQKTMRAMDLGAELERVFSSCGVDAKERKPMHADGPTKRSSACATR